MQIKPVRIWITTILLGWCFDFLFYKHTPGISFAIFTILVLTSGFLLLWIEGIRPAKTTILLVPFILYFVAITFIRQEPLSIFLATFFSLFLMAGLAVTYRGGLWFRYSLADYFTRGIDLLGSSVIRPITYSIAQRNLKSESETIQKPVNQFWPVFRGIMLAIPILAFFAAFLSSADLVFAQRVNDLINLFQLENLPEYIFRFSYILVLAYVIAGVFLHAAQRSQDEKLLGLEKPLVPSFLGFIEASIILGSVVLLFTVFVVIQFQYFFGGQVNINLSGYTYAEYARKGFGELVSVAFFALLLFLGLTAITRRTSVSQQRIFSILGLALLVQVGVMLVSAYQRLVLYENAYGFTRLRTYTHVFMIWIAVLLAVVVLLDLLKHQRGFALAALLASLGFGASLTLLNVDAFIFQRNLARSAQGQSLDVGYLATLSSDTIPAVVSEFKNSEIGNEKHDRLGAVLACFQFEDSSMSSDTSWQSFHLSTYWARVSIRQIADSIASYKIDTTKWPVTVSTPLKAEYECSSSMID